MPRERDPPYVAAGFRSDAQKLLDKFVVKNTLTFAEFACVWRELKFSTIFMGREGIRELTEFVEECYRNTLLFMDASNVFQKVGAVYLLYSLYLKQPISLLRKHVPIACTLKQVYELMQLESHFLEDISGANPTDLIYIINYLFKTEAISVSCFPIPMGPVVPIPLLKLEPLRSSHFKEVLGNMNMFNERDVKSAVENATKYEEIRKTVPHLCTVPKVTSMDAFNELKETISELEDRYNAGLKPNRRDDAARSEEEFRSLGERRAMLKSQQYERAADVGMSRKTRGVSSDSSPSRSSSPVKRRPGRPKIKGKRGRKKKVVDTPVKRELSYVGTERGDDRDVDNPEVIDDPGYANDSTRKPRQMSKYPRPIRKHYFEDN